MIANLQSLEEIISVVRGGLRPSRRITQKERMEDRKI
jgi:hypothetical protein